jgi:hypothetical protein
VSGDLSPEKRRPWRRLTGDARTGGSVAKRRRDPVGEWEKGTGKPIGAKGGGGGGRSGRATAACGSGAPVSARGGGRARPGERMGREASLPHRDELPRLERRRRPARRRDGGGPGRAAAASARARVSGRRSTVVAKGKP